MGYLTNTTWKKSSARLRVDRHTLNLINKTLINLLNYSFHRSLLIWPEFRRLLSKLYTMNYVLPPKKLMRKRCICLLKISRSRQKIISLTIYLQLSLPIKWLASIRNARKSTMFAHSSQLGINLRLYKAHLLNFRPTSRKFCLPRLLRVLLSMENAKVVTNQRFNRQWLCLKLLRSWCCHSRGLAWTIMERWQKLILTLITLEKALRFLLLTKMDQGHIFTTYTVWSSILVTPLEVIMYQQL
jgi:hypothetical protein